MAATVVPSLRALCACLVASLSAFTSLLLVWSQLKAGLLSKIPYKIDIGAVFNAPPNLHDSIPSFKPCSKEFVLDIDMVRSQSPLSRRAERKGKIGMG